MRRQCSTGGLVVVHVDSLQLEVRIAVVAAGWVDAMLAGDLIPELQEKRITNGRRTRRNSTTTAPASRAEVIPAISKRRSQQDPENRQCTF